MTTPTIASGTGAWTPGPWMIFDDADRFEIAVGLLGENRICEPLGDTPEQAEANGYLIAAAPELYEALDRLLARHGNYINELPGATGVSDLAFAKTALAKAEGRNP